MLDKRQGSDANVEPGQMDDVTSGLSSSQYRILCPRNITNNSITLEVFKSQ